MSKRLDQEREQRLEPLRMEKAVKEILELGYVVDEYPKHLEFVFKGSRIMYYPYSGWASGKTIKDGRGLKNLLRQIKQMSDPFDFDPDSRPTCRRCHKRVKYIYPLRDKKGNRSAWCVNCIIAHGDEIKEPPSDFNPTQALLRFMLE